MPTTDKLDPKRAKLRRERAEPRAIKSKTDMELPREEMPNTEIIEPKRENALRDNDDPRLRKSRTESESPICVNP